MAWNDYKPKGAAKGNEPGSGGAVLQSVPKYGIVKDNIDPLRCGRLRVYVEGMSGLNPDDADSWITVQYMSPFYGQTLSTSPNTGYGSYKTNTHSYGFWAPAPDIGTTVVLLFINGDPNFGVWIGALPEPAHLQMVPAIGAAIPGVKVVPNEGEAASVGGAPRLPATNVNSNNEEYMSSPRFMFEARPLHSYATAVLFQQGLIRDPLRGVIGSSAQREAPSRVTGMSTPGRPIYSGGYSDEQIAGAVTGLEAPEKLKVVGRRGGHSLVMDDGDIVGRDQLIRLRTSLGHQILMSDDGQCLFIAHSNGKTWIELGKEGTIDMYATNSVNIRTVGDLNLHADNNINMFAKKAINMSTETLTTESAKDTLVRAGGDYRAQVVGNYTAKVGGAMSMASDGEGSYYSSATMYINGKRINLNTGRASTTPQPVKPLPVIAHTDTLFDKESGWLAAPGKLPSIVTRAPAHMPWDSAGSGVPVKVELDAANALPQSASPAVQAAQAAAQSATGAPTSAAQAQTTAGAPRTVPPRGPAGPLDQATVATGTAALAATVGTGPAAAVAAVGGGVAKVGSTAVAVVGNAGLTPQQLENAGVLKPGAAAAVQGRIQAGVPIEKAMPPNLFTGVPGAETLQKVANNVGSQVQAMAANFTNAAAGLQKAGVITGKESPGAILGPIMAAATNGVASTVNFIKGAAGAAAGAISGVIGGAAASISGAIGTVAGKLNAATAAVTGGVTQLMNIGSKAGAMAAGLGGGLTALANSISGAAAQFGKTVSALFDTAKGIAAGAFGAIKASIPKLQAGVPQDVKAIAEAATQSAQGGGLKLPGVPGMPKLGDGVGSLAASLANSASSGVTTAIENARATASAAIGSATGSLLGAAGALQTAATNATNTVNQVVGTANKIGLDASKLISSGSGVASGLNFLPGGMATTSAYANNFGGGKNVAGGIAVDTVQSLSTSLNTGISQITGAITSAKITLGGVSATVQGASNIMSSLPQLGKDPAQLIGGVTGGLQATASKAMGQLSSGIEGLKTSIAGAGGTLKDLAMKNLPPGAQSQLQSAIAGLSTGDSTVSLPTLATNTADFTAAVDSTVSTITGPGISLPKFGGNPATFGVTTADALLAKAAQLSATVTATASNMAATNTQIAGQISQLSNLSATLPEGAPQIAAAKAALDQATTTGLKLATDAKNLLGNVKVAAGTIKNWPG